MKAADRYLKFVLWSDEDDCYVGYCPGLFPWGGLFRKMEEETHARNARSGAGLTPR